MDFSNTKRVVLYRIGFIILTSFFLASQIYSDGFIVTQLVLIVLLIFQVVLLVKYTEKSKSEVMGFLNSIKHDDLGRAYSTDSKNEDVNKLNAELNRVLIDLKEVRKEKEAEYQYLKNIVQHIGIGLITFNREGDIQIMNTSAKKLLRVGNVKNVSDLRVVNENLVDTFMRLRTGGRDLIRFEIGGEIVQLAIYAIELTLSGELYKLVSIQNIQNELEEKEMEAWQNLVRVLTHEIMNSVTPISSLATTVEEDLNLQLNNSETDKTLSDDDFEDMHLAIQTIQKRSEGLITFVQDFRNLTHIPKPKIAEIKVKELLDELVVLHKNEIKESGVVVNCQIDPENLTINADKTLIDQVLINLLKNALQAFDEQTNKLVQLSAYFDEKSRPIISIKDNGNGIDDEALEKIFIPFFTTKKTGSGIGLSLSRQIMRQHQGVLGVKSKIDEGTEFFLRF
ncbi:MAG: ATP-binding protein [Bacteroidota bacterium]